MGSEPHAFERREKEIGYYLLLGSLLALLCVFPFLSEFDLILKMLDFFVMLVLVSVITAIYRRGSARIWVVALTLIALAFSFFQQFSDPGGFIEFSRYLSSLLALVGATFVILRDVMRKEEVSARKICGAVCVYFLMGVIWAFGFAAIDLAQPEAFAMDLDPQDKLGDFVYFSFITLSTLGYGDITPATAAAKSMASLEAITGQLYLTVLVARLVGLHISQGGDH